MSKFSKWSSNKKSGDKIYIGKDTNPDSKLAEITINEIRDNMANITIETSKDNKIYFEKKKSQVKNQISKVQLPLAGSHDNPPALAYNKTKSIMFDLPLTDEIMELFTEGEYKIFVSARVENGDFIIEGRAEWQDW